MPDLPAVGIDLGTTYSSLAIVEAHGKPVVVPNSADERLTPSAVFFDDDTIVVGQMAKDHALTDPGRVVQFVKRQIGNDAWHFDYKQKRHSAADVSAMILAKLKKDAEQYLNRSLPYAVITVPAYFDDVRRRAVNDAGQIAGFRVLGLINEPTAAAIAFGTEHRDKSETVLVYDLGGGTFDVTIMRVENQQIQIIATAGDHQLGGKDFDDAIIRHAVQQFSAKHGTDPTSDPHAAADLRQRAEKAKQELSRRTKTSILVRADGGMVQADISRELFESLIKPKLDRTLGLVRSVLAEAKLQRTDVNRVLLIGGSTRIPAVRSLLNDFFGFAPDTSVNPEEAVCLGAALMAARKVAEIAPEEVEDSIIENVGPLQITDVTSHSLGIEAMVPGTQQRINAILIPRNSPIPAEVSKEFLTTLPDQRAIKVVVYQGEFQDPRLCNPVGEFILGGLPPNRPVGRKVRVTVSCGGDGTVNVTATDIETGKEATKQVNYASGQSAEQVSAAQQWLSGTPIE